MRRSDQSAVFICGNSVDMVVFLQKIPARHKYYYITNKASNTWKLESAWKPEDLLIV